MGEGKFGEGEAETIPGGVTDTDEPIAADDSRAEVRDEPDGAGDRVEVTEGPIGSASLKEPSEVAES